MITLFFHCSRHSRAIDVATLPKKTPLTKYVLRVESALAELFAFVRANGVFNRQVSIQRERLADGAEGTRRTLATMAAAVRGEIAPDYAGYLDERIRRAALSICSGILGHHHHAELAALLAYCRDQIAYRLDPVETERVQDPMTTLELQSGDCDDKCTLLAALLAAIGHHPRFVAQFNGSEFDHVYCEALVNGEWVALDPTADGQQGLHLAGVNWRNPAHSEWTYRIF